jgi:hypothetical protein
MGTCMRENSWMVDLMERDCICGLMVNTTMDNGRWIRGKDKVHSILQMDENI